MGSPFTIRLGPLDDSSLAETLQVEAGMKRESAELFQRDAEDISRMHIRGYIGDQKAQAARSQLFRRIEKELGVVRRPRKSTP